MVSRQAWISAARLAGRYVVSSARGRMAPKVSTTLVASAATGRAMSVKDAKRPFSHRRSRTHVSIAANVRIGAGSMEYWKWKDQKFGDDDQNRSRNEGSATRAIGESRVSSRNARADPAHTRAFAWGVKSSFRLSTGCVTTCTAALSG